MDDGERFLPKRVQLHLQMPEVLELKRARSLEYGKMYLWIHLLTYKIEAPFERKTQKIQNWIIWFVT